MLARARSEASSLAGREHRIDRIQDMAQVALGPLTLATTQVRLEGSGRRIQHK
jgi:hypothetical protein